MSRLTQDLTAETVSRDQIFRHARGQGNTHFSCSAYHEQDWQHYQVDPYCATLPAVMRRTFLISVPDRGLKNRKNDNIPACSSRPCLKIEQVDWDNRPCFKQGTLRRLDSSGSWYKLDSGWDSGRHRNRNPNHNKNLCDSTSNGTDQYQNGSSNLLTRNREQTRSTRKQIAQSLVDVVLPHDCYYDITLTGYYSHDPQVDS